MTFLPLLRLWMLCGLAPFGQAPGSVTFTTGFPVAIPKSGCVLVMGKARPSPDFTLRVATVEYWKKEGGVVDKGWTVLHPDGSFLAVVSGLTPGQSYNFRALIVEINGADRQTLANIGFVTAR
ncbi:MAG: hypothetical protein HYR84_12255 [Planctomycetes bacterium]|nr:hypothetical protein [Planctomycetota bacterium]